MMLPPSRRSVLEDPRVACRLELAAVRRRIALLEAAQENALAWLGLGLVAIALEIRTPAAELARLWLAEALLESALEWYERHA